MSALHTLVVGLSCFLKQDVAILSRTRVGAIVLSNLVFLTNLLNDFSILLALLVMESLTSWSTGKS